MKTNIAYIGFEKKKKSTINCLNKTSNAFIGALEYAFYRYGVTVARRPFLFIFISLAITGLCSIGFINFTEENDPLKLWIPQDSEFLKVTEWQKQNFPSNKRYHSAIYEADNVLDKKVILEILRIHEEVANIKINNVTWNNVCFKIPVKSEVYSVIPGIYSEIHEVVANIKVDNVTWNSVCTKIPDILSEVYSVISEVYSEIHEDFANIKVDNVTWNSVCAKIPYISKVFSVISEIYSEKHEEVANTKVDNVTWNNVCDTIPEISEIYSVISEVYSELFEKVDNLKVDNVTWNSVCASIPDISEVYSFISEVDFEIAKWLSLEVHDWSKMFPRDMYCNLLENMNEECMTNSLLEIWGYKRKLIESLTNKQIIDDLNKADISEVFHFPVNFSSYLGMVQRNSTGQIIGAKATTQTWMTTINKHAIADENSMTDKGSGSKIDKQLLEWENKFIDTVLSTTNTENGVHFYFLSDSSYEIVTKNIIQNNLWYLSIGFIAVFIFVLIMLGKFNMIEMRPVLALLGLSSIGLSIGVSYGICSAFGFSYSPVNSILPFLLLGLGIDDMFVIMQAWNNLSPMESKEELPERVGLALRHAGVSITVTSLTNFAAFAIGSSTLLPALSSFCIYAAFGIIAIYFFSATFFVACLTLDQRRMEDKRNGLFWCWKMNNWTPNECSQKGFLQSFFGNIYAKFLFKLPIKIFVLIVTAVVVGVSGWGVSNLQQEFDYSSFLPQNSYPYKFIIKSNKYFPSSGVSGQILFGNINYTQEMGKILELQNKLKANPYIGSVDSWVSKFRMYMNKSDMIIPDPSMSEDEFYENLTKFLFSPNGFKYRERDFKFDREVKCLNKTPPILSSTISYQHIQMDDTRTEITAMDQINEIIAGMQFSGYVKAWSHRYAHWETNKVISGELLHNLGYAMLVVFFLTLILISSLSTSILVLLCVVLTLVDVGAMMHWWGLTIDTVSCINLVVAIGLCVDYAAHIGHAFMTKQGTRNERARLTVEMMGPAVLQGGFSTILAFLFLAFSDSHVFITFFKIFFSVSLFGLYHGLVFLPVVLSIIGPAPYQSANQVVSTRVIFTKISPKNCRKESLNEIELNEDGIIMTEDTISNITELDSEN